MFKRELPKQNRRRVRAGALKEESPTPSRAVWIVDIAKNLLVIITLVSVGLGLSSYGYESALLNRFDVRPEQLNFSAGDYLLRAYKPVLTAISDSSSPMTQASDLFLATLNHLKYFFVALGTVFAFSIYLASQPASASRFAAWHRWLLETVTQLPTTTRSRLLGWGAPVLTFGVLIAAAMAATFVVLVGTYLVLWLIVLLPASSIQQGRSYAQTYIIDPPHCRSVDVSQTIRDGALCYRVGVHGEEIARGRLVEQGVSRIVLYRRNAGVVLAPLDGGAVLEQVNRDGDELARTP